MVQVDFHTGVEDPLGYACLLLRKAVRAGARIHVEGELSDLDVLDQALWTFDPQDFVAHARRRGDGAIAAHLAPTPVWLVDGGLGWPQGCAPATVLLRLQPEAAVSAEVPPRVLEIVGAEASARQAGRQRWRDYQARGWSVRHHAAAPAAEAAR